MAANKIKIFDARGNVASYGGNGRLFKAATEGDSYKRKRLPEVHQDTYRNISGFGRKTMSRIGRWLAENDDPCKALIRDLVESTTQGIKTRFETGSLEWNEAAFKELVNHDKVADVKGSPFNNCALRRMVMKSVYVDGDCFVLLTKANGSEFPLFQFIPSHRVYSKKDEPMGTRRMIDGVIVDSVGRATHYRVWDETGATFRDIQAENMVHFMQIDFADQVRGVSQLASTVFNMQDCAEYREFELRAQKIASTYGVVIYNNEGGANEVDSELITTDPDDQGSGDFGGGMTHEYVDNGDILYMQANSGEKIDSYRHDRPTNNQDVFESKVIRNSFASLGWSYFYSLDPIKLGSAAARFTLDKLNNSRSSFQENILFPGETRKDMYRVSKLIEIGRLEFNEEWYKIGYTPGPRLTADRKYEADISTTMLGNKLTTIDREARKMGITGEQLMDEQIREMQLWRDKLAAAELGDVPLYPDGPSGSKPVEEEPMEEQEDPVDQNDNLEEDENDD